MEGENCVYHDDYGAAKEMGIYVGKSGKQKIAYIGVTREDKAVGTGREDGFLSGLAKCGMKMKDGLRKEAKFTMESGYERLSNCFGIIVISISYRVLRIP